MIITLPPFKKCTAHTVSVGKLLDVFVGAWRPNADEQAKMVDHLIKCAFCRTAFEVVIEAAWRNEDVARIVRVNRPVLQLLSCFHDLVREIDVWPSMPGYIDLLECGEVAKAARKYPRFFHHIAVCKECRGEVASACDLLRASGRHDRLPVLPVVTTTPVSWRDALRAISERLALFLTKESGAASIGRATQESRGNILAFPPATSCEKEEGDIAAAH